MSDLIDITALAGRWGRTEREAIEIVRRLGVPYLPLNPRKPDMRVNWRRARFSIRAVEAWEAEQMVAHAEPAGPPNPAPARAGASSRAIRAIGF